MGCKVQYKSSVFNDLKNIDRSTARRILDTIEKELAENPDKGIPLEGNFKGLYKYRIGSYRVIFSKMGDSILILRIGHRSKVYKK
ncbi:MAG: type II toxin-antitoxin system RelE family toxin [Thermoplasmatota archaeon]